MAELETSTCYSTEVQESCCEPAEKAECCGSGDDCECDSGTMPESA